MAGLEIGLVTVAAWLLASFDLDDYNPALGRPINAREPWSGPLISAAPRDI